jgi:hypothetical protein
MDQDFFNEIKVQLGIQKLIVEDKKNLIPFSKKLEHFNNLKESLNRLLKNEFTLFMFRNNQVSAYSKYILTT